MIHGATKRWLLHHNGVIIYGEVVNTGIGLIAAAKALGSRTVIVIPNIYSQENGAVRPLSAELIEAPVAPPYIPVAPPPTRARTDIVKSI